MVFKYKVIKLKFDLHSQTKLLIHMQVKKLIIVSLHIAAGLIFLTGN